MGELHQNPPHLSPMIRIDHLGESSILNVHFSYIEDNACFKFRGIEEIFLCFLNSSNNFNDSIFSVFFLFLVCLVAFCVFGYF